MSDCKKCKRRFGAKTMLALEQSVKTELHDHSAMIDGDDGQDWFSLVLGWAIGKGYSARDAYWFSLHIRYHTNLG